jgi:DNA-binding XRE family transcriptional regulator
LLRSLIKCGLCGLTFSGMRMKAQREHYYRCNGRQFARGLYGLSGKKCPSKSLNGDYVERLVWADIESFLRNPGELLERLRERVNMREGERQRRQKELADLTGRLQQKATETDRVLALFRRGRIDEATLDHQLDLIKAESDSLQVEVEVVTRALSAGDRVAQLQSAEALLATLRSRLDGPIAPELKRKIVEILVERVQASMVEHFGVQQSELLISYRFNEPDEPAPLILPRSHRMDSRRRAPEDLKTLGDHLRRRRLTLQLLQRQVAEQLGVTKATVHNWETNRSNPNFREMPAIIRFLGYNPTPASTEWAVRLVQARTNLGLSQKESAHRIGVDPSTLARWERGDREPKGTLAIQMSTFLTTAEAMLPPADARPPRVASPRHESF